MLIIKMIMMTLTLIMNIMMTITIMMITKMTMSIITFRMSASRKAHFFAPGRAKKGNKSGGEGPGVLIVEGRWRYRYNRETSYGR